MARSSPRGVVRCKCGMRLLGARSTRIAAILLSCMGWHGRPIARASHRRALAVAWSPNGSLIASGNADGTVQVWNATTGGPIYTYRGHYSDVHAVAWSPSGLRLASASTDGTVQVWDATTGSHVYIY